jgi:hypothetical protein
VIKATKTTSAPPQLAWDVFFAPEPLFTRVRRREFGSTLLLQIFS